MRLNVTTIARNAAVRLRRADETCSASASARSLVFRLIVWYALGEVWRKEAQAEAISSSRMIGLHSIPCTVPWGTGKQAGLEPVQRLGTEVSLPIGSNAGWQVHWLNQESVGLLAHAECQL